MARLLGVNIPNEKKILYSLTYIQGIGKHVSGVILKKLNIDPDKRTHELSDDDLSKIGVEIDNHYVVEGQLRRQIQQNIARLKKIGCYRGYRHARSLPVRGQRTRNNCRTRKGKKKTIAVKKSVKSLKS